MKRRYWTPAGIAKLRELYPRTLASALAKRFKRKIGHIHQAATRYGIRKDPEFVREVGRRCSAHPRAVAQRFKPGHAPANKGLRRPGWFRGRMRETQFKKGQFPFNRDPDFYVIGALRVNSYGYIDMRISFAPGALGWRALHIILWEDAHGPVPKGFKVRLKDGNKDNVVLENLELISNADNLRRNSIHHLPAPLASTINLLGQLKRRIREKQNGRSAQPPVCDARSAAR